jgi:chemotaxis protein CheX
MIAGSFNNHLSKGGLDIHLSTPSVIHGKECVIMLSNKPDQIAVRFATDDDWFMVPVGFVEN